MKKLTQLLLVLFTGILILPACNKGSAVNPAKTANLPTTTSFIIATSVAGTAIWSGTGPSAPPNSVGNIGDFYINTTYDNLYGPKTASGWGPATALKGTAGTHIWTNITPPPASTGAIGDYYLDQTTFMLYGPKTAAGWNNDPLSLKGPEGNANVQTQVVSVTNTQWIWNSQYVFQTLTSTYDEYFTRYYDDANTSITQDVLNNGMVVVYFTPNTTNNVNQWAPLPYEFTDASGDFNYEIAYETNVGTVRFHYFFVQLVAGATIPVLSTYDIPNYQFKVVAVTGTALGVIRQNHIDIKNYDAVARVTGLWMQDKK